MAIIRIPISAAADFMTYFIAKSVAESDEDKNELSKLFKLAGLRKFQLDNKERFMQKYKIFIRSLHNNEISTIQFIQDDEDIKIEPDKERPKITTKLKRLIRRLTGSSVESVQILEIQEMIKQMDEIEAAENIVEKYIF